MKTKLSQLILGGVILAIAVFGIAGYLIKKGSNANITPANVTQNTASEQKEEALMRDMRKLWSDHIVWTRQFIVAALSNSPDKQAALDRLLKNQEDIGNAIVPFYGNDAGAKLTDLLKQHIMIAGDLLDAAKNKDNARVSDADMRWKNNANDIAAFLSNANPNWSKQSLMNMLNEHLSLTKEEATARLQKQWNEDIMAFDKVFNQAMTMADMFSEGIMKQFPDKF